jgi:hypothetical protein
MAGDEPKPCHASRPARDRALDAGGATVRDDAPDSPCHGDGHSSTLSSKSDSRRSVAPGFCDSQRWACRHLDGRDLIVTFSVTGSLDQTFEKFQSSWSPVTESNRRPSPYHLGAKRSMKVVDAAQKPSTVTFSRCRALRLLHFAAAPLRFTLSRPVGRVMCHSVCGLGKHMLPAA